MSFLRGLQPGLPKRGVTTEGVYKSLILAGKSLLVYYTFTTYIGTVVATNGISMVPTIPHGYTSWPWVLESRLHRRGRNIHVGDVITFVSPRDPSTKMSKRVVGMPGDFVSVVTPGRGDEDLEVEDVEGKWAAVKDQVVRVPDGHCWVAGDNLEWSRDSRVFGPVPLALIRGKVLGVLWPRSAWKWFGEELKDAGGENKRDDLVLRW